MQQAKNNFHSKWCASNYSGCQKCALWHPHRICHPWSPRTWHRSRGASGVSLPSSHWLSTCVFFCFSVQVHGCQVYELGTCVLICSVQVHARNTKLSQEVMLFVVSMKNSRGTLSSLLSSVLSWLCKVFHTLPQPYKVHWLQKITSTQMYKQIM